MSPACLALATTPRRPVTVSGRAQPVGIDDDDLALFRWIRGRNRRIVDAVSDGEDPRRVSGQRHRVQIAPEVAVKRNLHLNGRFSLELPRNLHVDLSWADEVNVARKTLSAAVE